MLAQGLLLTVYSEKKNHAYSAVYCKHDCNFAVATR